MVEFSTNNFQNVAKFFKFYQNLIFFLQNLTIMPNFDEICKYLAIKFFIVQSFKIKNSSIFHRFVEIVRFKYYRVQNVCFFFLQNFVHRNWIESNVFFISQLHSFFGLKALWLTKLLVNPSKSNFFHLKKPISSWLRFCSGRGAWFCFHRHFLLWIFNETHWKKNIIIECLFINYSYIIFFSSALNSPI